MDGRDDEQRGHALDGGPERRGIVEVGGPCHLANHTRGTWSSAVSRSRKNHLCVRPRADHPDLVWGYDDPLPESAEVEGLMCFYNEKVDLEVDGRPG